MLGSDVGSEGDHVEKPYRQHDDSGEKDRAAAQSGRRERCLAIHAGNSAALERGSQRFSRWTAFSAHDKLFNGKALVIVRAGT